MMEPDNQYVAFTTAGIKAIRELIQNSPVTPQPLASSDLSHDYVIGAHFSVADAKQDNNQNNILP